MENKEATRICGQCHKEVAEANFALHETHCSRFLCLCPDCDESVPREQLNQHREEQHTQVKCSKCNQKMERRHLMDHESDECVERLQACQFCELELPSKELDGHCLVCGSRTELCKDCNRYVKLRDQPEHGSTCSANDTPPDTKAKIRVNCSGCMASFPAEDINKHELECTSESTWPDDSENSDSEEGEREGEREDESDSSGQVTTPRLSSAYKATSQSDRPYGGPLVNGGDPDQISTCPHCHLALPLLTLRWHQAKCQIHVLLK
ncbi:XIAP-associated factor 1 [Seriola dumerili]|uniref:XIAP associated factor 1 n=1 Tax=Seriola dumerili TaxID=41447 RepID=A0A3B4VI78_SERDU|nr:XIAP-associated factor 1 [Seriola dumerili]